MHGKRETTRKIKHSSSSSTTAHATTKSVCCLSVCSASWKYGSRHWDTWDMPQTWINDTHCICTNVLRACVCVCIVQCVLHANISNSVWQIMYFIYLYPFGLMEKYGLWSCRELLQQKNEDKRFVLTSFGSNFQPLKLCFMNTHDDLMLRGLC